MKEHGFQWEHNTRKIYDQIGPRSPAKGVTLSDIRSVEFKFSISNREKQIFEPIAMNSIAA